MGQQQCHPLQQCPVSGLPVTSKPQWAASHKKSAYTAVFEAIGKDIVHCRIVAESVIRLDHIDSDLFRAICAELDLLGKPTYVLVDLNHVREVSISYKKDFANLLYNKGPAFTVLVMYNIHPDVLPVAQGVIALCPDGTTTLVASDYREAMEQLLRIKKGDEQIIGQDTVWQNDTELATKHFFNALCRLSWIGILEFPVWQPSADSAYLPFFQALDGLRKDLLAKEQEHRETILRMEENTFRQLEQHKILLNAKRDLHAKMAARFTRHTEELNKTVKAKADELAGISAAAEENSRRLKTLYRQIRSLDLPREQKRRLLTTCKSVIEVNTSNQTLGMTLTETDSRFLSLLKERHPDLSEKEMKISLLIRHNHSTENIALTIGLGKRGMETLRFRLHKKLGLKKHQALKTYLVSLTETD